MKTRHAFRLGFVGLLFFSLLAAGCQPRPRLGYMENIDVEKKSSRAINFKPTEYEQWIRVHFQARYIAPVTVYVVLEQDHEALLQRLQKGERPGDGFLARSDRVNDAYLDATVPPGKGFTVVIVNEDATWASIPVLLEVNDR